MHASLQHRPVLLSAGWAGWGTHPVAEGMHLVMVADGPQDNAATTAANDFLAQLLL